MKAAFVLCGDRRQTSRVSPRRCRRHGCDISRCFSRAAALGLTCTRLAIDPGRWDPCLAWCACDAVQALGITNGLFFVDPRATHLTTQRPSWRWICGRDYLLLALFFITVGNRDRLCLFFTFKKTEICFRHSFKNSKNAHRY